MADFVPSQKYASDFNKSKKYENGDAVQAETVNNLIEGQLFVQGIATNQPKVVEDGTEGSPTVYFENKDGLQRFVFRNIKGDKGKGEKGDNGNIMRFTDGALYARSDAGTTLSIGSVNLINGENVASGDVVLDTHYQEGENYYICIWQVTQVTVGAMGTTVFLRGMDYIPSTGGGGTVKIEVDNALSETSENPVQNKVVTTALNAKVPTTTTVNGHPLSSNVTVTKSDVGLSEVANESPATIRAGLNDTNVKNALGYTPAKSENVSRLSADVQKLDGSVNALNTKVQEIDDAYVDADEVKGFISEALDNFSGDITVDMELSDTSTHPIANKVVTEALKGKLDVGGTLNSGKVLVTDQNGKILSSGVDANKLNLIQGLTAGAQAQIDNINTAIGNLDTKVDGIDGVVDGHTLSLNGLKSRLNTVEADVDARAKTIEYSWESKSAGVDLFKLNLELKDANGNQLSKIQIDFPLEQMVVGAQYDKVNKKLILELPDTYLEVPVADIFEGLVTDSNISEKTAGKAKVLETARKITFEGDVTGDYTFDGSSGKIVTLTVADDSHNHIIGNIDNLQDTLNGYDNKFLEVDTDIGQLQDGKLDRSECSKFYSRKGMSLSSYGWYRVAKFNANNILSVAYGSMANSCDIIIQSGYFYYSPSTHRIQLLSRYYNSKFQSLFDFGEGRIFSKIRHVVDTNNNCAYIDIYYNLDTENPVFVEILNGHSVNDYWWEAIDSYMVAATTDGEDVRCVHELGTNTTLINSGNYGSYALPLTGGILSGELKTHNSALPFQDISTGIEAGVKSTRIQAVDLIANTITLGNNSAGYSSNLPLVIRKYNTVSSANPANTTDLLTIDTNGNIKGYIEAVQGGGGGYLRIDRIDNEVNTANTTNHCILLGKPWRDKIEFYEYGGEFNFYKSQGNVNTLLLHIHPDAFQYKGQNVVHSGNFETYMQNYLNTYILEKGY